MCVKFIFHFLSTGPQKLWFDCILRPPVMYFYLHIPLFASKQLQILVHYPNHKQALLSIHSTQLWEWSSPQLHRWVLLWHLQIVAILRWLSWSARRLWFQSGPILRLHKAHGSHLARRRQNCQYSHKKGHKVRRCKRRPQRLRQPYWRKCSTKRYTSPYPIPIGESRDQIEPRCIVQTPPGSRLALLSGSWGNLSFMRCLQLLLEAWHCSTVGLSQDFVMLNV